MTLIEAINKIDALKPNGYSQSDKIAWLSQLDGLIKKQIIDTHEGGEFVVFEAYGENTPLDTPLIAEAPYDTVYLSWLEACIDYANGEYARYNNTATKYNGDFSAFERYYNRTHMPIGVKMNYFGRQNPTYYDIPNSIVAGTTPTHTFTLPFDAIEGACFRIVYAQGPKNKEKILFELAKNRITLEGRVLSVKLRQDETLLFDTYPHHYDGKYAVYPIKIEVGIETLAGDVSWSEPIWTTPERCLRRDGAVCLG